MAIYITKLVVRGSLFCTSKFVEGVFYIDKVVVFGHLC